MKIEIINKEGTLITTFELETNPFKVGETISINISNYDKEFWNIEEVRGDYMIDKIEHFLRKIYQRNQKCYTSFSVSVEVTKLP